MEQNSIDLGKKFVEIVKGLIGKDKYNKVMNAAAINGNCAVKCEDQFAAQVKIRRSKISFIKDSNIIVSVDRVSQQGNFNKKKKAIILILESPHGDEYKRNNNQCVYLGPAMGSTKNNINNYLLSNLLKYNRTNDEGTFSRLNFFSKLKSGKYNLVLLNAVQYQCSLNLNLEENTNVKIKEEIFNSFFKDPYVKQDFIKRINDCNPSIIINCCTGGEYKKNKGLQNQVQDILDTNFKNKKRLMGSHPSSGFFCRGFWNSDK